MLIDSSEDLVEKVFHLVRLTQWISCRAGVSDLNPWNAIVLARSTAVACLVQQSKMSRFPMLQGPAKDGSPRLGRIKSDERKLLGMVPVDPPVCPIFLG